MFLHIAIGAFAFTFVFGWGANSRDDLCNAQFAQAKARFEKLQTDIERAANEDRKMLEARLDAKDSDIDKWSKDYEQLLAGRKDVPCILGDDDARGLR